MGTVAIKKNRKYTNQSESNKQTLQYSPANVEAEPCLDSLSLLFAVAVARLQKKGWAMTRQISKDVLNTYCNRSRVAHLDLKCASATWYGCVLTSFTRCLICNKTCNGDGFLGPSSHDKAIASFLPSCCIAPLRSTCSWPSDSLQVTIIFAIFLILVLKKAFKSVRARTHWRQYSESLRQRDKMHQNEWNTLPVGEKRCR